MVQSADGNVVAVELDGMGVRYRADVDGSGYFRLEGVPAGEYSARVIERSGAQTDTDFISLRRGMPWLTLRVPTTRREISGGGTISAARLAHVVPKDARKELEKANKAVEKKDNSEAVEHLKKALAADPDYTEAHNTLGTRYIVTGDYQLALEEFEKALKLDMRNPVVNSNIAAALLGLQRPAEAESAARRSIDLNGASSRAHYLLAVALIQQGKVTVEAEKSLRQAADELPAARLILGKLLIAGGRLDAAENELKSYLASGRQQERSTVEEWLQKRAAAEGGATEPQKVAKASDR